MSRVATAPGRRRRRIGGLRLRVTAAFAIGGLVLIGILAVATYAIAEHYLTDARERSLRHQAQGDARLFAAEVRRGSTIEAALGALDRRPRTDLHARVDGRWYRSPKSTRAPDPPRSVLAAVGRGARGDELRRGDGPPEFIIGIPLPTIDAEFYETSQLVTLDNTLRVLRDALIVAGVAAIVLGVLGGLWLSRLVLRPVSDFAGAARRVAAGDLETRLVADGDRDLDSLADSFNDMVDSVDQRIQREVRFVADVSHELRSPITALATSMDILVSADLDLPPSARPAFDLLALEVDHLRQLVEDLLELSRADAGVEELELSPVVLGEFMQHAVDPVRTNGAHLVITEDLAAARVLLDKRRLERVLSNLVANAETHGAGLREVAVSRRGDFLRVDVEDLGGGVDPEERGAVFTRFYRGRASGRRANDGGSGLGLALVAEHVKLHGGRVAVEDADASGGARFVIEVPWRTP
jgi:signal transduction histidine kinase